MDKQKEPKKLAKKSLAYLKEAITNVLTDSDGMTVKEITGELGLPIDDCPCKRIVRLILHLMKKEGTVVRKTQQKWVLS